MAEIAYEFLQSVVEKKEYASVASPDRLAELKRGTFPLQKEGQSLTRFRLGKINKEGDIGRAKALLFTQSGFALAEIALLKSDQKWMIDYFSLDYEALALVKEKSAERFEPNEYKVFTPF